MKGMYFTNHWIGGDEYQLRVKGDQLYLYNVSKPENELIYETTNFDNMKHYIAKLYHEYANSII